MVSLVWSADCFIQASWFEISQDGPIGYDGGEILRCLYCGTEYWLPSQVKRDPDFCSLGHREKYNSRVELALRRVQESETPPPSGPAPPPAASPFLSISARVADEDGRRDPLIHSLPDAPRLNIPRLKARPIFDRLREEIHSDRDQEAKEPEFIQIFGTPETPSSSRRNPRRYAIAAAAAGIVLWFGPGVVKFGIDLLNASFHWAFSGRGSNTVASAAAAPPSLPQRSEPGGLRHPVEWLRSEAYKHATSQLADNFDRGMAAWGAPSQGWVPGWARSADGYVRPGQLALFQPTIAYADYRMDFFGQIESSGMSWVVRGKDTENYYAMKVNILRPGLRPVLSMTHYPVVQGRPGHVVKLPLSVMTHNGMPYHVSVEVNGSHYTASIEGEEVDSWSDDTLPAGGVGFFSDAGERARIYWVKVSRNDDWFGWLCGQIATVGQPRQTAWLGRPPLSILPPPATSMYPIASYFN